MAKMGRDKSIRDLYPWNRQKGETVQAFEAFQTYYDLGSERTVVKAAEKLNKSHDMFNIWSMKWKWGMRVQARDNHELNVEQAARDKVRAKMAAEWEKRRLQECEDLYVLGSLLRDRAVKMLKYPLSKEKTSVDGKTIIIEPSKWTVASAVTASKASAELITMAIDAALEEDNFDPLSATLDQCRDYIAKQIERRKQLRSAVSE
jgi:hypothetical protein